MLYARLRRQFVVVVLALLAAVQGLPHSSAKSKMNLDGAVSIRNDRMQWPASRAGYIFSGTVLSVERVKSAAGVGVDTMRITFAVHEGLRGVRSGKTFSIQEWAGLWSTVGGRFRPGERVFLFLYPRSRLGLTSVVGGTAGRYQLDSNWRIAGTNQKPGTFLLESPRWGSARVVKRGGMQRPIARNNKMRDLTE